MTIRTGMRDCLPAWPMAAPATWAVRELPSKRKLRVLRYTPTPRATPMTTPRMIAMIVKVPMADFFGFFLTVCAAASSFMLVAIRLRLGAGLSFGLLAASTSSPGATSGAICAREFCCCCCDGGRPCMMVDGEGRAGTKDEQQMEAAACCRTGAFS